MGKYERVCWLFSCYRVTEFSLPKARGQSAPKQGSGEEGVNGSCILGEAQLPQREDVVSFCGG